MAGRRVLLVDADLGLANVDVQLGLEPGGTACPPCSPAGFAVADAARPHAALGFDILAGCSGSGALAGLDEAAHRRLLAALRATAGSRWDDVVLDLGAGLDRGVRALAAGADLLLVVATEEPTSLTDAYAVLKLPPTRPPGGRCAPGGEPGGGPSGGRAHLAEPGPGLRSASSAAACRSPACCAAILRVPEAIRRQSAFLSRHPTSPLASEWMRCGLRSSEE